MTFRIDRETLPCSPDEFARAVEAHASALVEYAAHLLGVEADAANQALKPHERRVAFPPPSAPPLVEAAVKAGGYELVGPSLEVRKQRLCAHVDEAEQIELAKVMPPRKERYWQMREQDIRTADHMCLSNHQDKIEPDHIEPWLKSVRPTEDTTFLAEQKRRRDTLSIIQRWAAKAHHDVDDLTEETIDGWKLEPFVG